MKKPNALSLLLDEIDELCRIYVGKDAPSEAWIETCNRFERINKLRKRARAVAEKEPT